MFSEPSLEDPLEECFAQSKCDLDLDKFLEQTKTSNEPSLEDPLGECLAKFEFNLDFDMIREQAEALLNTTPMMRIENGETTKISSPKSSSSAAKPLIVDSYEEEGKEEQVEHIEPLNNPNMSNHKEMSTEAHSLINFPFDTHNEKLIVTREGIIDSCWEIDIVHGLENIFERHVRKNFCKSIPKRFQAKEWSLEDIWEVLKRGECYILLKKRWWKGLVGHPNDRGKCGMFLAKDLSLEYIREVLKLGECYILLKKKGWKGIGWTPK
jgi:hypothetical protein